MNTSHVDVPRLDVIHATFLLDELLLPLALIPLMWLTKRLRTKPELLHVLQCFPVGVDFIVGILFTGFSLLLLCP